MALIKCQHTWLKWLDKDAKYVRVLSFDFSKAFDHLPHDLLFEKVKKLPNNPYVVNWMISFLGSRRQRVAVDGIVTEYLNINRGVPQETVIGPILFSIMVDDIKTVDSKNELVKFADDLTLGVPGTESGDTSRIEFDYVLAWSEENRMPLNMKKTYEMVVHGVTYVCDSAWPYPLGRTKDMVKDLRSYLARQPMQLGFGFRRNAQESKW